MPAPRGTWFSGSYFVNNCSGKGMLLNWLLWPFYIINHKLYITINIMNNDKIR